MFVQPPLFFNAYEECQIRNVKNKYMGILNTNIHSINDQATRLSHLYEKITYTDELGSRECIVLEVDNKMKPTIIGELMVGKFVTKCDGSRFLVPNWSPDQIFPECHEVLNTMVQNYLENGWYIPTIDWYTSKFGKTRVDTWYNPDHMKFHQNILSSWDNDKGVLYLEFLSSTMDKELFQKPMYKIFLSYIPNDVRNTIVDKSTPVNICTHGYRCYLLLLKNIKDTSKYGHP